VHLAPLEQRAKKLMKQLRSKASAAPPELLEPEVAANLDQLLAGDRSGSDADEDDLGQGTEDEEGSEGSGESEEGGSEGLGLGDDGDELIGDEGDEDDDAAAARKQRHKGKQAPAVEDRWVVQSESPWFCVDRRSVGQAARRTVGCCRQCYVQLYVESNRVDTPALGVDSVVQAQLGWAELPVRSSACWICTCVHQSACSLLCRVSFKALCDRPLTCVGVAAPVPVQILEA
jgi:hypothetical protein